MRSVRLVNIALIVLLVALCSSARAAEGPLERAAREAGVPLVVRFGLDRCMQCIEQGKVFDALAPRYEGQARFRFVHIGREEDMAARYKVLLIPTVVIFDAQGREVFRHVGLVEAPALEAKLREVLAARGAGGRDEGGPT